MLNYNPMFSFDKLIYTATNKKGWSENFLSIKGGNHKKRMNLIPTGNSAVCVKANFDGEFFIQMRFVSKSIKCTSLKPWNKLMLYKVDGN